MLNDPAPTIACADGRPQAVVLQGGGGKKLSDCPLVGTEAGEIAVGRTSCRPSDRAGGGASRTAVFRREVADVPHPCAQLYSG